jgi:hypothetical protein
MSIKVEPVYVVGVDSETLEKDYTFKDAYAFYIRLSDKPDRLWRDFLSEWEKALFGMKMKIDVAENRLRVVFTYDDDVKRCAKYAASLVTMVNKRAEEHNKQVGKSAKEQQANQEHKKEEEILEKLRELRDL